MEPVESMEELDQLVAANKATAQDQAQAVPLNRHERRAKAARARRAASKRKSASHGKRGAR